ncbi:transposase [Streptomyces prasinus]|uniref:transposase n=1 Tax=Streptomyces prasinus TaxID=67345 RepID=UPI0033C405DB
MPAPRKYPDELRERATRLAVEARQDPADRAGAIRRVAEQFDVHPEALRTWVKWAETDEGLREGRAQGGRGRPPGPTAAADER